MLGTNYTITGRVTNPTTGAGIAGVTIARTGSTATVITNASGNYAISGLSPGTTTLVPSLARYVFTPANRSVAVSNANVTNVHFTGVGSIYSIRGRFTNNSNVGITNAQITCTGKSNAIVDANGDFVFENLKPGNYTVAPLVTPALSGVTLSPASRAVTITASTLSNISFTASFSVNGRLSNHSGVGIPNVQIQRITGASVVSAFTDAQGYYRFTAVRSGNYTVSPVLTPAMTGMSFTPTSKTITVSKINLTNINFTGMFSISGRIADRSNVGIRNVRVMRKIGVSTLNVFTDANGYYRYSDTRSGDYTITPVQDGRTFSPSSRSISVISQNFINQNFSGTGAATPPPASYTMTGKVVNSTTGNGIAGVSVTRTGSATAVVTNATGDYTFTGVVAGTYIITPSLSGYSFSPTTRSVTVGNANVTVANFIGAPNTTPAPTVTSFSPTSGPVGMTVVITGTNLTGATAVKFNTTNATVFGVNSATQITAAVPSGATTGKVSVVTAGGTGVSAANFTVTVFTPAPTVTGFTPTSGPVGTSVVITGTNLTGASEVKFNATNAIAFTVNSATQITATVPSGATTGKISVTTPGSTAQSAANFTVTVAATPAFVNNFADAKFISGSTGTLTGSNVGYTRETNEPTLVGNSGGASAWIKWTAPGTGNFVFTTAGSSFDTLMGIVTGNSLETLTGYANDDENTGVILTSRMVQAATAGTTYYIVVDGYSGETGDITLSWSPE